MPAVAESKLDAQPQAESRIDETYVDYEHLMRMTETLLTEIAQEVGYSSNQVLARVFVKHQRMSPTDFRRAVRDPRWGAGRGGMRTVRKRSIVQKIPE